MAIAFDTAQSSSAATDTVSYTHTVGAGLSNAIAIVGVSSRAAGAATATFGGTSMTAIRSCDSVPHCC